MSDWEIHQQRIRRHIALLADAARLEHEAHQLIVEAHQLRKLADEFMPASTRCNAATSVGTTHKTADEAKT